MKINVACGASFAEGWVNVDFLPGSKEVRQVNILNGLPFADNSCDVIYASHFLEHLTIEMAESFLRESYRVLRAGGRIRIVVPDLEEICSTYIKYRQSEQHQFADFVAVELIDQCVRMKSGGQLERAYREIQASGDAAMIDFVYQRTGYNLNQACFKRTSFHERLKTLSWGKLKSILIFLYVRAISLLLPKVVRDQMMSATLIGEKHLWLYDFKMLRDLLEKVGYKDCQKMKFDQSGIENFQNDGLDQDSNGRPRKGNESMYVESVKM